MAGHQPTTLFNTPMDYVVGHSVFICDQLAVASEWPKYTKVDEVIADSASLISCTQMSGNASQMIGEMNFFLGTVRWLS